MRMQVTFNSLIAACAQGAQWEKAAELFEQMHGRGCRPDPVTYGGLIAAYEKVCRWGSLFDIGCSQCSWLYHLLAITSAIILSL